MSVVDLDKVRDHLNITTTTDDAELSQVLDAAEGVIANRVGPLEPESRTVRVQGGGGVLVLPIGQVSEVDAVADADAAAVTVADLYLNSDAGTLEYTTGAWFSSRFYDVTFTTGWDELPEDLVYAVKEMARHLWTTQRGGARRPGSTPDDAQPTGYLIPNRVTELIAPYVVPKVS